jgi:hypothetical protein
MTSPEVSGAIATWARGDVARVASATNMPPPTEVLNTFSDNL